MSTIELHMILENRSDYDPSFIESARQELLKRTSAQLQTDEKTVHAEPECNKPSGVPVFGILAVGFGIAGVFMPYFAAVFFVPAAIICGIVAVSSGHVEWGVAGIIIGIIGLIWISTVSNKITSILHNPGGSTAIPQTIFDSPPLVTESEYNQIREGMSYSQVCQIIGANGEELSRTDIAGYSTVMYQWINSNGSNMNAMFQNGSLVSKAQFGLP